MSQLLVEADDSHPLVRKTNGKSPRQSVSSNNPRLADEANESFQLKRLENDGEYRSIHFMHKFAREGDAEKLEMLIKHNQCNVKKHVDSFNAEKLAPLHYAARYNHFRCVKLLVEKAGANVNVLNDEKVTPLHFAARYRRKWQNDQKMEGNQISKLKTAQSQPNIYSKIESNITTTSSIENIKDESKSKENNKSKRQKLMGLSSQMTVTWKSLVGSLGTKNVSEEFKKRLLDEEDKPTAKNSVILYLVSKGANPNAQDTFGCSPLHYAAMRGNEVAASQLLILIEIKTDLKDNENMTALHLACFHNHYEIGRMLLEKNSYLFHTGESGCNPFHIACGEGNVKLVNLMINLAENRGELFKLLTETNQEKCAPLHYAVENNHFDVAKLCLEKGANSNAVTNRRKTALHMAAHCGSVEIAELLNSYGAKLDVIDKFHQTPMHAAAAKNHTQVISYLIEKGADTESRDKDSYTPLLTAAAFGHVEAIRLLMNNTCDIFAVEKQNKSVLYIAVEQNHPKTVKAILSEEGTANLLNIPDFKSNYPLHIACKEGREEIVKMLLDEGAVEDVKNEDERTPMHLAAKYGRTCIVKVLIERSKKSLISNEDEDSNTPLHLAAKSGFPKVIQLLLDMGADITSRNCNKWTALDCAAANGNLKAAQILLQNYAPVDPMDRSKITPLYLACKNGHEKLVSLLLRNNADVSTRVVSTYEDVYNGFNPLDIAIENGHRDCALVILNTPDWKVALRNQTKSVSGYVDTPMRKLIRKMPDVAEEVFNKCTVTNNKHYEHKNFEITYNFEFLEDSYAYWHGKSSFDEDDAPDVPGSLNSVSSQIYDDNERLLPTARLYTYDTKVIMNNHPLTVMAQSEREELLNHPLVTSLLKMKWNTFGRLVYYTNLSMFICFLISLLVYMYKAVPPYQYLIRNGSKTSNETTCFHVKNRISNERLNDIAYICKYVVLILGSVNVFKEIIQFIINGKHYLSLENLLEWMIYILAFVTVLDLTTCQKELGIREDWQWQTGTVAAFLGMINMVLFIKKVPFFGIFVVMFTDVMWTFIKFLPLFLLFIFAFAFSFYILLSNQVAFDNLANSMLRTTVMMIGEFDFDATFNSQLDGSQLINTMIFYDGVTYFIFVIFILMMSIITMNLLVGLAVDDIKAVQEKATLKRLAMQVTLALEVEGLVPEFIRRRFIIRKVVEAPNRKFNLLKMLFGIETESNNQWSNIDEDMDQLEKIEMQQKESLNQTLKLKYKLKNLDCQCVTMKKMLTKLLKYLRIDFEEEDILEEEI